MPFPASTSMFIAKISTRVRSSALNSTEEVSLKGSGRCVTDSKAIARVEAESLMRTGLLLAAAAEFAGPVSRASAKRGRARTKNHFVQDRRLLIIEYGSIKNDIQPLV